MGQDPRTAGGEGQDPVEGLLARCLDRFEEEGEEALESLCREHPQHAAELRRAFRHLAALGLAGGEGGPNREGEDDAPFPERLGEFHLLERIGGGGMGVVFLAEQESLGRRVAVKMIRSERLFFPDDRARFRREVKAVARLHHPGIVQVFAVGEDRGIPFYAMEWLEGGTLAEILDRVRVEPLDRLCGRDLRRALCSRDAPEGGGWGGEGEEDPGVASLFAGSWVDTSFRIVHAVALALHHAHARGVIHRDVKPSNVLVTPEGRVVLLDFGVARAAGDSRLTASGIRLGSLPYMPPEQLRGPEQADEKSDVYSLGVTLYELLTLRAPYAAETTEATVRQILQGTTERIRGLNRAVPRDAETVCLAAMDRDPARRYAGMTPFARDLRNFLDRRPIEARRAGALLRGRRFAQRHPVLSLGLVLLHLALLASLFVAVRETRLQREILRLSDSHRITTLESEAQSFWPADPARIERMDLWLEEAGNLLERYPRHEESLRRLRSRALPYSEEMRRADRALPRRRLDGLLMERRKLEEYLRASPGLREDYEHEVDDLEERIAREEKSLETRRTWRFRAKRDQWHHDLLAALVEEAYPAFERLVDRVRRQREAASTIRARSIDAHAEAWERAIGDIAGSEPYGGLVLEPQLGLRPLRRNPASGLWEFLFLESGRAPEPDPTPEDPGRLRVREGDGIVLVLLPGGVFWMGASPPGSGGHHPDPWCKGAEEPENAITLAPFFLSKYEITWAQWRRLGGKIHPAVRDLREPASMGWNEADAILRHRGLELPTEAQWEYACRAGTDSVFHCGDDPSILVLYANVADRSYAQGRTPPVTYEEGFDDGWALAAPVGSFLPNPFGLHDMHGNVSEWCRDVMVFNGYRTMEARPGDGLRYFARDDSPGLTRVLRGGAWNRSARFARCAARAGGPQEATGWHPAGFRAARAIRAGAH